MATTQTPEALRQEARRQDSLAEESFQRCDTDGFLTQWAHGLTAEKCRLQAQIEENGGVWEFPALFDLEGNRVRAKLISTYDRFRYGYRDVWAFCDEIGRFTGQFLNAFPKRESTMAKKGYREGREDAPAKADIRGNGYGLSGTAWVAAVRKDGGYPTTAI